MKVAKQMYF